MQQDKFIQALDLLEGIDSIALSQEESIETLLLKSKALRAMELVDRAIAILRNKSKYLNGTQLKTKILFELSKCYAQKGELNLAKKTLVEILASTESGPLAHNIALKLGNICLKLGQNSQAVSVYSQLLELQPSEQIKQETLELLAMAYNQQNNYDRAALALLGQWK
jgi:tetratricopeptide (TPR) repeat protein